MALRAAVQCLRPGSPRGRLRVLTRQVAPAVSLEERSEAPGAQSHQRLQPPVENALFIAHRRQRDVGVGQEEPHPPAAAERLQPSSSPCLPLRGASRRGSQHAGPRPASPPAATSQPLSGLSGARRQESADLSPGRGRRRAHPTAPLPNAGKRLRGLVSAKIASSGRAPPRGSHHPRLALPLPPETGPGPPASPARRGPALRAMPRSRPELRRRPWYRCCGAGPGSASCTCGSWRRRPVGPGTGGTHRRLLLLQGVPGPLTAFQSSRGVSGGARGTREAGAVTTWGDVVETG